MEKDNLMKRIKIGKVVVNIGCKGDTKAIEKANELLSKLTAKKPVITLAKQEAKTFGIKAKLPMGVKVTLRGPAAIEFLKKVMTAVKITSKNFDSGGNVSFGVKEYINIKGMKYDPKLGMFGMDVSVNFERPGFRVQRRKIDSTIGKTHRITQKEAIAYLNKEFGEGTVV